jgi:hypothetical protein
VVLTNWEVQWAAVGLDLMAKENPVSHNSHNGN